MNESKWIDVNKEMPNDSPVLICYLKPFFGMFKREIGVGYFDNPPEDYLDPKDGKGWLFWIRDIPVRGGGVTHWMPLPTFPHEPPPKQEDVDNVLGQCHQKNIDHENLNSRDVEKNLILEKEKI